MEERTGRRSALEFLKDPFLAKEDLKPEGVLNSPSDGPMENYFVEGLHQREALRAFREETGLELDMRRFNSSRWLQFGHVRRMIAEDGRILPDTEDQILNPPKTNSTQLDAICRHLAVYYEERARELMTLEKGEHLLEDQRDSVRRVSKAILALTIAPRDGRDTDLWGCSYHGIPEQPLTDMDWSVLGENPSILDLVLPVLRQILVEKEMRLENAKKSHPKGRPESTTARRELVRRLLTVRLPPYHNHLPEADLWKTPVLEGAPVPPLLGGGCRDAMEDWVIYPEAEKRLLITLLRKRLDGEEELGDKKVFLSYGHIALLLMAGGIDAPAPSAEHDVRLAPTYLERLTSAVRNDWNKRIKLTLV
jgi:hypothetical protein